MKESFYTWSEYSFRFSQKARDFNYSPIKIGELLHYAERFHEKKLPIIYDRKHLSYLTGFRYEYIIRATKGSGNFYRKFKIKKTNGKFREIMEPLPGLKQIQYWILEHIISKSTPNPYNNAYCKGKSIVTNAKFHTKQEMVLNVDIEKYFDNIKTDWVREYFIKLGYNSEVSETLCKLITLGGGLPQGAPCSPYLSSILTKKLDVDLLTIIREKNLRYSRYADDITVSGTFNEKVVIHLIKECLNKYGFKINNNKTTVRHARQRQMVTGVVVNQKISIKKDSIKSLRQAVYYISKLGLENHMATIGETRRNYLYHLLGKANYYLSVKKKDKTLLQLKQTLKEFIKLNPTIH